MAERRSAHSRPRITVAIAAVLLLAATMGFVPRAAAQAPLAVTSCNATVTGPGQVRVTWTPSAGDNADRYAVYRSRNGGTFWWAGVVSAPGTAFTNNGIEDDTYRYRVVTVSGSNQQATRLCTPTGGVTLPAPGGPGPGPAVPVTTCAVVDGGNGTATVSWIPAPLDNSDRYAIYRSRNGGTFWWAGVVSAPGNTFLNTGIEDDSYRYRVRAVAPNGSTADTNCTPTAGLNLGNTGAGGGTAPVAVTSCSVTDLGGGNVRINWTRAANDNADRYAIYRSRNGGTFWWAGVVSAPGTSFTNTGVPTDTFRYQVRTVKSAGFEATRLCSPTAGVAVNQNGGGQPDDRPNILIIMTDDQRRDGMEVMPRTEEWFGGGGTNYEQGYVTTPSCCPSRSTLLTGQYNHNNGVISQLGPGADTDTFLNKYLQDAGYLTGHIGKYLNYQPFNSVAPNWDRYGSFICCYYNQQFNFDGQVQTVQGYTTDIVFDTAIDYVQDFENRDDDQPWLLHVTTTAPHRVGFNPPQAAPEYVNAPVPEWIRDPAVLETDVSDKPPFIYCCNITPEIISSTRDGMFRSLMSVDDGVDRLMRELEAKGELENTLAFYLSDNGWLYSDHQAHEKFLPYTNSVGVPFYVRWPGEVAAGATSDALVSNVDVASTALAAAGVTATEAPLDGIDIINGRERSHRLTEYWQDNSNVREVFTWAAYTTLEVQYTEYYNADGSLAFQEYYDLVNDPYELDNLFVTEPPGNRPNVTAIRAQLAADRNCVGSGCP